MSPFLLLALEEKRFRKEMLHVSGRVVFFIIRVCFWNIIHIHINIHTIFI
jgi:hypothetical protein